MKSLAATLTLLTLLGLSQPVGAETLFGKAPSLQNVIKISALLDHPEQYLGKEIRVEGIATDVCPRQTYCGSRQIGQKNHAHQRRDRN